MVLRNVLERKAPGAILLTDAMDASNVNVTWKAPISGELATVIS